MADAVLWPRSALPARSFRFDPSYRNLRGPAAMDGLSQVGSSDAGLWKATLGELPVLQWGGRRNVELWYALSGLLEGILTPILIPVNVVGRRPLPTGVTDVDIDGCNSITHSDEAYFSDDVGYQNLWIDTTLDGAALRGATQISITKTVCGDIAPGMRFSIFPSETPTKTIRLYQVKRMVAQTSSAATFSIWPPLREALSDGQRLEFSHPYAQMRLASDSEMDLTVHRRGAAQFPTVNFLEDL